MAMTIDSTHSRRGRGGGDGGVEQLQTEREGVQEASKQSKSAGIVPSSAAQWQWRPSAGCSARVWPSRASRFSSTVGTRVETQLLARGANRPVRVHHPGYTFDPGGRRTVPRAGVTGFALRASCGSGAGWTADRRTRKRCLFPRARTDHRIPPLRSAADDDDDDDDACSVVCLDVLRASHSPSS